MRLQILSLFILAIHKHILEQQKPEKKTVNKLLKAIIKHDHKNAKELSVAQTVQLYLCAFHCAGLYIFLVIECKDVIVVCDGLKQEIDELIMGECMI